MDELRRARKPRLDLLDAALDWCAEAGLSVIVDLHIIRSHYFNDKETPRLFTDEREAARLVELWEKLSAHLRSRSTDLLAYELLNEPVAPEAADWNRVATPLFERLRALESQRTILLGSNFFNSISTLKDLAVPAADPHCILTFHYYHPMMVTHYRASWFHMAFYDGPIRYPGLPAPEEAVRALPAEQRAIAERWNEPYDATGIEADLREAVAVRERAGYPLYCGEFGCYHAIPLETRLVAWYRDIIALFRAHDIGWSNWDYRGGFGLVTGDGDDTGIAAALLA